MSCLSSWDILIHITKKQPEAPNQDKKGTGTSEEQCSLGYRQALSCLWLLGLELVLKLLQDTRSKEAIILHTGGIGNQTGDNFFSTLHDQDTSKTWHIFYLSALLHAVAVTNQLQTLSFYF